MKDCLTIGITAGTLIAGVIGSVFGAFNGGIIYAGIVGLFCACLGCFIGGAIGSALDEE